MSDSKTIAEFEVWRRWIPTDMGQTIPGPARLIGIVHAASFQDACRALVGNSPYFSVDDKGRCFDWGELLPDEKSANEGFAKAYRDYTGRDYKRPAAKGE